MKISLVTPDFSLKTFKRTKFLYDILKEKFDLEVISLYTKKEDTSLFEENFTDLKKIKFDLGNVIKELNKNIKGDVLYAVRSKPTSLGIALNIKSYKKIPAIVDISMIESSQCFLYSNSKLKNILFYLTFISNPNSYIYTLLGEKRIKYTDNITVSSKQLQKIYGGTFIPSIANDIIFNKEEYKIKEIREYMNWNDNIIILYYGNIEKDTDINTLLESINNLKNNRIKLVVLGNTINYKKITDKYSFVSFLGVQSELNTAKLISSCDYAILPIKNILYSESYIPDEIYKYISCNKKIISSKKFDEIDVLDNKIIFYDPENIESLEKILKELVSNNTKDEIYSKYYSYNEISTKLIDFFSNINLEKK
ncbi:MAG: glycosyltransferase [Cyanobacteriota bacterium]